MIENLVDRGRGPECGQYSFDTDTNFCGLLRISRCQLLSLFQYLCELHLPGDDQRQLSEWGNQHTRAKELQLSIVYLRSICKSHVAIFFNGVETTIGVRLARAGIPGRTEEALLFSRRVRWLFERRVRFPELVFEVDEH